MEPFILEPVLVERPWGGRRFERFGRRMPVDENIGESWEVADLPDHVAPTVDDPRSRVATGPLAGASLADLIDRFGSELMGPVAPTEDGRFPLLVKLLDAREHLSVQVHPHERYVAEHPEARLKTESWYVMESDPDASLFLDVRDDISRADVLGVLGTSGITSMLRALPAEQRAFHHVPAGLIHALGAGVMVAEVQSPSDTTFRIYDWAEEYGRAPRQLHTSEAAASIVIRPPGAFSSHPDPGGAGRDLVETPYYWMVEHRAGGSGVRPTGRPGPRVFMIIEGEATIGSHDVTSGSTVVVPASHTLDTLDTTTGAIILEVGLPPSV
jgi:mannose-6-phosphate isomerase